MIKLIKKFILQFTLQTPKVLSGLSNNFNFRKNDFDHKNKKIFNLNEEIISKLELSLKSFGDLNKDKIFYVIKRSPGTGMYSNVTFILNHLKICEKLKFIPIIDMENFVTIYNEKKKVFSNKNAWNYYFENLNNFSLNEVYKSQNVIFTSDKFFNFFSYNIEKDQELSQLLRSKIKVNKFLNKCYLKTLKKFKKKKILGIHFRGTSYKRSAGHPLPATKRQMYKLTEKLLDNKEFDFIFLATEEKNYLEYFKNKFGDKLIYLSSCYRSNINDAFKVYPRRLHRYKMGREAVLEAMLLSNCDYFVYLCSNISSAAIGYNFNPNQKRYEIDNGFNSKNIIFSQFYWYIKKLLPEKFGGFKNL